MQRYENIRECKDYCWGGGALLGFLGGLGKLGLLGFLGVAGEYYIYMYIIKNRAKISMAMGNGLQNLLITPKNGQKMPFLNPLISRYHLLTKFYPSSYQILPNFYC